MSLPVVMAKKWRSCPECDVRWNSLDRKCWSCGKPGVPEMAAPRLTSTAGFGSAMTERHWRIVRREIGVDPED